MIKEIEQAIATLKTGGIILYPTDNNWALGCDATNEAAVAKIFALKQKKEPKELLILLDNHNKLGRYVVDIPDLAYDLSEMSEKPITIIYDKGKNLAPSLLFDNGSIAIRVTHNDFAKMLITKFGRPLVCTPASISGTPTPINFSQISQSIIQSVDYAVIYRQKEIFASKKTNAIIRLKNNGEIQIIES